jgi:hypothetical protein
MAVFTIKGKKEKMNKLKKLITAGHISPLIKFAGILAISLIILYFYSNKITPLKIFNIEIKQSGIRDFSEPSEIPVGKSEYNLRDKTRITPTPVDSSAQRFLLIGDSMLEVLGYRLNDYCMKNGHEMNSVIWYSSSTLWYGSCDTISYFINKFNPTYVILVIGSNELFIKDIRSRDKYVKNILKQVGDRKYFWVGPPNWKDDTGINDLIVRNVGHKRYYPSKNLVYERFKDGAHPTKKSGVMWMDSVAAFIMKKSMYPVLLNYPDMPSRKNPPLTILGPHPPKD